MVLGRKTNLFLVKTQKFWQILRPDYKKMIFMFSLGKSWVFGAKPFFS